MIAFDFANPQPVGFRLDVTLEGYNPVGLRGVELPGQADFRIGMTGRPLIAPEFTTSYTNSAGEALISGVVPLDILVYATSNSTMPPGALGYPMTATAGMTIRSIGLSDVLAQTPLTGFTYRTASGMEYPFAGGTYAGRLPVPAPGTWMLIAPGGSLLALGRRTRLVRRRPQ